MADKRNAQGLETRCEIEVFPSLQATWGDATSVDFLAHGQRRWMIWAPKYAFEVDVPDDVSAWSSFNALRELFNEVCFFGAYH